MIEKQCKCGDVFLVQPYEIKRGKGRFCSHACAASVASVNRNQYGHRNPKWKGGVSSADRKRRYALKHPEKHAAHALMTAAIRKGIINKSSCEICGNLKVEGHHDDYSMPLNVRWLCKKHHLAAHGGRLNNKL